MTRYNFPKTGQTVKARNLAEAKKIVETPQPAPQPAPVPKAKTKKDK